MLILYSYMDASINWHDSTSMILVSMVVPDCYGAMREMGRCRSSCRINQPWIIPAQITLKCINALDGRANGQTDHKLAAPRSLLAGWLRRRIWGIAPHPHAHSFRCRLQLCVGKDMSLMSAFIQIVEGFFELLVSSEFDLLC